MGRVDVNEIPELANFYENKIELNSDEIWIECEDLNINFDFHHIPLESIEEHYREQLLPSDLSKYSDSEVEKIHKANSEQIFNFRFKNIHFSKKFQHTSNLKGNFEFDDCHFNNSFNWEDITLEGKIKLWNCSFNTTNFNNTTFSDLVDFYNCTFKQKVFFYKTDFKGTTVFSASTFEQNVLFTYALIEKPIIFRGTTFEKGLDLSLAIFKGEINPFDIRLNQFNSKIITKKDFKDLDKEQYKTTEEKHEKKYDECISQSEKKLSGQIPLKNKRETFRILKRAFTSRDDISASIKYKVLENETMMVEQVRSDFLRNFFNFINLVFNFLSNRFGKSYMQALFFVLVFGWVFFYLSAVNSNYLPLANCSMFEVYQYGKGFFIQFLLPTHKFNYISEASLQSTSFLVYDFIGRILVGYGIYQFIQAFRKYR